VTFLFTDIEGSTRLWERVPDAMRSALARHDKIVQDAIAAHSGLVFARGGDGFAAAFARAGDALGAARDAQAGLIGDAWPDGAQLRVRMGLHTGEVEERDGDYFGADVNRAARLMRTAHGGQIVLSRVTAELARRALLEGLALLDLGEHRLRGLDVPEHVYELVTEGHASRFPPLLSVEAFPGIPPLPEPAITRGKARLAGRDSELDRLEGLWKEASAGSWQVALMGGEPGIGKTSLTAELSARVHAQGGVVLYGRCDEETIVPYQPFVEALRPCIAAYEPSRLRESLHGMERDLVRIFPELAARIPELSHPDSSDPEAERYRLFEAITTLVTGLATTEPTVLVLDDLHWADKPTLLLLRHLLRSAPRGGLLVIACYQDVELEPAQPMTDLLADLRREPFVTRLTLTGLSRDESGELLRGLAGGDPGPGLTLALYRETEGNPFFLKELLRHLLETGVLAAGDATVDPNTLELPESVREVVGRRLRRLPSEVTDLLTLAAVVGQTFDADVLGCAARQPVSTVLELLDRASDAGVVREDTSRLGRFAFSHALIRQTLTATLGAARRAQLHATVGTAIEATGRAEHAPAELALHFASAVPLVGAAKAIEYSTLAGHDAIANMAFEDAATSFQTALRLLEEYEAADTARRVELLILLASAQVYVDEKTGVETALRAVDAARTGGSPAQFGEAVAVFVEPTYGALAHPAVATKLFDEARSVLGDREPAVRARLASFEAFKYATYQLHGRDGRALAEEALCLARSIADPVATSDALFALAVSREGTADAIVERVQLGEELVSIGQGVGARASAFGLRVLAGAYLELGDPKALADTIRDLGRVGDELGWLPARVYAAQWRGAQALMEGRFDDVRASGDELRRYARGYRGAGAVRNMQAFYLARECGELGNVPPRWPATKRSGADLNTAALIAFAQLEAGQITAAEARLDVLAAEDFRRDEIGSGWGSGLAMLAEVAATGPARAHAAALYELLSPFRSRLLAVVLGIACLGAADRYLGMLSTMLERWDEAEAHFDQALILEERSRGRALLPRTRYWQARLLLARDRPGDSTSARTLLASVLDETSRLGMRRLQAQAEELRMRLGDHSPGP